MIYQDRLGTDAWKIEHPTRLFCTANVVEIRGSATEPVRNVRLSGFTIAHTAPTFMEKYEVPSGGDWSLHRNAAVFIDSAKHASFAPFYTQNDHYSKTGSGQTQGKLKKRAVFRRRFESHRQRAVLRPARCEKIARPFFLACCVQKHSMSCSKTIVYLSIYQDRLGTNIGRVD
jgi:hypothetical protein